MAKRNLPHMDCQADEYRRIVLELAEEHMEGQDDIFAFNLGSSLCRLLVSDKFVLDLLRGDACKSASTCEEHVKSAENSNPLDKIDHYVQAASYAIIARDFSKATEYFRKVVDLSEMMKNSTSGFESEAYDVTAEIYSTIADNPGEIYGLLMNALILYKSGHEAADDFDVFTLEDKVSTGYHPPKNSENKLWFKFDKQTLPIDNTSIEWKACEMNLSEAEKRQAAQERKLRKAYVEPANNEITEAAWNKTQSEHT